MHRLLRSGLIASCALAALALTSGVTLAVAMLGCQTTSTAPEGEASARPRASVLRPVVPPLHSDVEHAHGEGTTTSRLMVHRITPADGIVFLVDHPPPGPSAPGRRPAERLRFVVTPSDGDPVALEATVDRFATSTRVDGLGAITTGRMVKWEQPKADVVTTPGRYRVRLQGLTDADVQFDTGEHDLEIVAASRTFRPISELAQLARRAALHPHPAQDARVWALGAMDDSAHNRWLWFEMLAPNHRQEHHVLMSPAGKVLAYDERSWFTCIAVGTPIATPEGMRGIETLRAGDQVIGWDLDSAREVVTSVRQSATVGSVAVRALGGLLLSATHPVWVDGEWRPASSIASGSKVLTRDGAGPVRSVRVDAPVERPGPVPVVDLVVDWPHNYFASGILVHNKAAPTPLPMTVYRWTVERPTSRAWKRKH
jgi:Pretoxin HINT domain